VQHFTELPDIKRVIVNTNAIEPQVLIATAQTPPQSKIVTQIAPSNIGKPLKAS